MSDSKKPKSSPSIIRSLTGAGGSGLVRLTPVESARLAPSQQIKADPETEKTQKKVFCPTIPTGRRVKKETFDDGKSIKSEKFSSDKRHSNIKKERQRVKREIIQSESVFSQGPAAKLNRAPVADSIPRGFGGGSVKDSSKTKANGSSSVAQLVTATPMDVSMSEDDGEDLEQLSHQNPLELFSDSRLPPICIPLNPDAFSEQKAFDSDSAKSNVDDVAVDTAAGIRVTPSNHAHCHSPADVINEGSYLFLKLPDHLPRQMKSATAANNNNSTTTINKEAPTSALSDIPEGCIGKLRIHKSGRTRLILGNLSLDVSLGTPCGFLQELVSIQPPPDARITVLGQVHNRVCCIPDFENILS